MMQTRAEKMSLLKNVILDTAVQVFSQKGYKATTMQDIADALHMTRTPLNYHFKNKKVLYEEVVRRYLRDRRADYERIDRESNCFSDMIWMHLQRCNSVVKETFLLDGLPEEEFEELAAYNAETDAYLWNMKKNFILRAIDTGELRPDLDVDALVDFLYVQFYGLLRVARDLPQEATLKQIDCIADMLLNMDIWGPASEKPKRGRFSHNGIVLNNPDVSDDPDIAV